MSQSIQQWKKNWLFRLYKQPRARAPSSGVWWSEQNAREGFFAMGQLSLGLEDHLEAVLGQVITIKAEVQLVCPGVSICKSAIYGQVFYTDVQIQKGLSVVSLVNCMVGKINGQFWVNNHQQSTVIYRSQQTLEGMTTLIETCAGIGAVGRGFREYDMHTAAYCDNNPKFCSWLKNHMTAPVIEGNINDMNTIEELSRTVPGPHVINGGVSCQPFSKLGDKGQGQDPRSQSFIGLLRAGYHLQSVAIVMECTPGVKDSQWAQCILQEFVNQTGYKLTQTVLEMHHMWPSVRNRWWAVLTHPCLGKVEIPPMPNLGWDPSVFHLMPKMMTLDEVSMEQLELDLYELRHFHNQPGGIARSAFEPFRPMPTATHSWGSQVKGCHCGCRASGFSEERINNRGLYGVLIPLDKMVESAMGPYHGMRHPHPMEVALVNGLEPVFVNTTNGESQRLALAGVGQLASPLQSSWVWGNVIESLIKNGIPCKPKSPVKVIVDMCKSLFMARDELLQLTHKTTYMEIFEKAICQLWEESPAPVISLSEDLAVTQMIHDRCIEIEQEDNRHPRKGKGGKIPNQGAKNEGNKETPKENAPQKHDRHDEIKFATSGTGGVLGFETESKRRKIDNIEVPSKEQPVVEKVGQPTSLADQAVSPTVAWTNPIVAEEIVSAKPNKEKPSEFVAPVHRYVCSITSVGDVPVDFAYEGNVTIGQMISAEVAFGNADPKSIVRTSVGTYVQPNENLRHEHTYVVFPQADGLNDSKCPRKHPMQDKPAISGPTRIQGLYQQKGWVAVDEMTFYLGQITQQTGVNTLPPIVLPNNPTDGVELGRCVMKAIEIATVSGQAYQTHTACLTESHWIPIKIEVTEEVTIVHTLAADSSCIRDLLHPINPDIVIQEQPNRSIFPADCGFQAAAWIMSQATEVQNKSEVYPVTAAVASQWRKLFGQFLVDRGLDKQLIYDLKVGGMPDVSVKTQLQNILLQHGVNEERVGQCAGYIIEQLGMQTIQQVLGSPNVWKDLKIRASQNNPPIKIVLAEELQKLINDRLSSGQSFGRKQNKENHRPKASVNSWKGIKASQVSVPQTVFKQQDGELLPQITVHQFHSKSKGIAVVNINEAMPFCQLTTPISSEGVGMIIVDYQDPRVPKAAEIIQFPAICSDTGDSMLVLGALIQLGQKSVGRNPPENCSTIEEIPTKVVRTMVYRDQFAKVTWESFVKGPVKALMELDEFRNLPEGSIIDVWDRQHLTKNFQKTKQENSELFVVSIRCTSEAAETVLSASGKDGIYHEPRTDSGRAPNEAFGVVWLPRKAYGEVIVAKQTSPVQTWVVRNGDRYGLRTSIADHQTLHRHHKPDVEFLAGETSSFKVGPLPYGTTRSSLQKVLKEWEWAARPVQPHGQVRNGLLWLVQANQVPPYWIYTMSHGDVLITQIEQGSKGSKSHPTSSAPLASQRTLQHLTINTNTGKPKPEQPMQDPFQVNDPWAPSGAVLSSSQIASIESQVEKRVMAQMQPALKQVLNPHDDTEMIPAVDDRVSQLESQVKQIHECMQKTNQSFQSFQQQQMQQNQNVTHQISSIKHQVDNQHQSMQSMLDAKMEDQMSRIEALLVKRTKYHEWQHVTWRAYPECLSNKQVWSILLESITMRLGEAKNPGPPRDLGLTIGAINACGLMNKTDSLEDLPFIGQSIWGVSESHLTATGIVKFRQDLKIKKSVFDLHHGPPAPYRSSTQHSIGGKHVGSGFLSTVPCKKLTSEMPADIQQTSRVDVKTFYCQGKWLFGATCYGYAHKAETQAVRNSTDHLLKYLTDTIVTNMKGYRFITGDFNQPHGILDQTKIWEQFGWKEVQVHLNETEYRPIQATCKNATTRDFVWLSPELLQHLEKVEIIDHIFPDHSVVCARLRPFFHHENVYLWRKPKDIDWSAVPTLQEEKFELDKSQTTSEKMLSIAREFENRISKNNKQQNRECCHPSQLGRSATTDTIKVAAYGRPIPKARQGDYQPQYHGISLQYSRWVKQMRRIESLCRNLAKGTENLNARKHADREWRGIMTASGFPGGFQKWWEQLDSKHGQAPPSVSWICPNFQHTQGISFTFMQELHQFEKILNRELQQKAKENRINNPNKIFDDIAKPRAAPIQLLEEPISVEVVHVNQQNNIVTCKEQLHFDIGQDLEHNETVLTVLGQPGSTKLKVSDVTSISVGDKIEQKRKFGAVEDIFEQFGKEWKARWDRHASTPETEWAPIVEFFELAKPNIQPQEYRPITIVQWKQSLRRKKKRAATGPDGWSREDLLHLPDDLTLAIIELLTQVEQGQPWPMQLMTGIVHSLEKTPQASRVGQFRPITIFSLIYRNWASIRAREALRYMMDQAPPGCYGNVPGKSATQLWHNLQSVIENCHHNHEQITGGVIDIVKCFNHLPRVPLVSACITLGMPGQIAQAWQKGLGSIERRFNVRGSTGPGIRSTTGFPEGCPLSVVAMFAANCIIHEWLLRKAPLCQLWTFVDNIEITASDHVVANHGMKELSTIVGALDLDVDESKTYMWSSDPEARKWFRQEGTNQKTWARDLGGHVQYSRQTTNSVITKKMEDFKPRWKAVQRSQAPYYQKLRALKSVAWANTLHGISSASIGDENYEPLRTGAVRALGEHHNGTSPIIHLSLVEHPSHDPAFRALWQTVIDTRNNVSKTVAEFIITKLAQASNRQKPEVGPCSVLLHRLNQIQWHWEDNQFVDHRGLTIDIWDVCIQELAVRLAEAWQSRVASEKACRKTFGGMDNAYAKISRINPKEQKFTPQQNSVIRNSQNGTFYTADHLKHRAQGQETTCMFCGQEDNVYHRIWECKAFEEERNRCPESIKNELKAMPPCTHNHGWFEEPATLQKFRAQLHQLPKNVGNWTEPFEIPAVLDLFTDGTCVSPECETSRLGAWGVAVYQPTHPQMFAAMASGILPGIHQTVTRAELQAAIIAAHVGKRYCRPYRLWVDNAYVVKVIKIIQQNWDIVWSPGSPNHDLLDDLTCALRQTKNLFRGVTKVYSHQKRVGVTPAELWAFDGNAAADTIAANVLVQERDIMLTREILKAEVDHIKELKTHLHSLFLAVAESSFRKSSAYNKSCQEGEQNGDLHTRKVVMEPWIFPAELPSGLAEYRTEDWNNITAWVTSLHMGDGTPRRWSWFQLYLDFQRQFEDGTPWYHQNTKEWCISQTRPKVSFLKQVRWFNAYILKVGQHLVGTMPIRQQIPDSCYVSFRTKTLPVCVSEERHMEVENILGQWRSCYSTPKELGQVFGEWSKDHRFGPRSCLLGRRFEDVRKSRKSV